MRDIEGDTLRTTRTWDLKHVSTRKSCYVVRRNYKKKVEIKETLVIFHCLFECLRRSVKSFSKIL